MFSKNLKYYRLKKDLSKKDLASMVDVSPMLITYYENGERRPSMDIIKRLAEALSIKVSDFLHTRNQNLKFVHAEFRKQSKLNKHQQEFIREDVEAYMSRFYSAVDILGGEVLPPPPEAHKLVMTMDPEEDAAAMRKCLGVASVGPVGNLIELLENRGVVIYAADIKTDAFAGMNGLVNNRPYVIYNKNMSPERTRSTIAHEMAHFIFQWPDNMDAKSIEKNATAISGAFLFPAEDAKRELGIRRTKISNDMTYVCREYGISMYMLVTRAVLCRIITENVAKVFYIKASQHGWKKNEPVRIANESPFLFDQLVFRAINENEISVQKGAELLQQPYQYVEEHCFAMEG